MNIEKQSKQAILTEKYEEISRLKSNIELTYGSSVFSSHLNQNNSDSAQQDNNFKSILIEKFNKLQIESDTSLIIKNNDLNKKARIKRPFLYDIFTNSLICKIFFPALLYSSDYEKIKPNSLTHKLVTSGTQINKLIKSLVGILGAWLITFILFIYIKYQLKADAAHVVSLLIVIFIVLIIGLAYNHPKFRCIILLIIPFMATNRGRTLILMNCYSLTTTVVLPNFLDNIELLQSSYGCNQQLLEHQLARLAMRHNLALRAIKTAKKLEIICTKVRKSLMHTKVAIKKNLNYFRVALSSLKNISNLCEKTYGDSENACNQMTKKLHNICQKKIFGITLRKTYGLFYFAFLGFNYIKLCVPLFINLCSALRGFHTICLSLDFVFGPFFRLFKISGFSIDIDWDKHIDNIIDPFIKQFEFKVDYNKNMTHSYIQDRDYKSIALQIMKAYNERLEYLNANLFQFHLVFPISFVFIIFGALIYYRNFIARDDYKNNIISAKFYEINEIRRLNNQPTVLPLNDLLKNRYVDLFDYKLSKTEWESTIFSVFLLVLYITPILFSLSMDNFMFSVNNYAVNNTAVEVNLGSTHPISGKVKGKGFMAAIYKQAFNLFDGSFDEDNSTFSNIQCLPKPKQPNEAVHNAIKRNIVILLVLTCFQEYIKRWRSILAGCVYPERDHQRAIWLYDHLLRLDSSMGLWLKSKPNAAINKYRVLRFFIRLLENLVYFIANAIYFVLMHLLCFYCFCTIDRDSLAEKFYKWENKLMEIYLKLVPNKNSYCLKCLTYQNEKELDDVEYLSCSNKVCKGFYCIKCVHGLDNICKLCKMPIVEYILTENESLERDSSDEENDFDENFNTNPQNIALNQLNFEIS